MPDESHRVVLREPSEGRTGLAWAFLSQSDAECGRVVLRSPDVVVTACLIDSLDDLTYWHAVNNGQVCRAFAGAVGVSHE